MRLFLILPLLCVLAGCASSRSGGQVRSGSAVEYHFSETYALVAATDMRVFLELRSYDNDHVLDSVVLSSRYMPPEFEARDAGTRGLEFIVRTRGGGTGLAETHVELYGIVGQHIRRFGDFVVARFSQGPDEEEELSGNISFPKQDELIYRYKQVIAQNGKTVTNSVIELYHFDTKEAKYEKAK